jgi:purine-nucleoside phosphorylase
MRKEFKERLKAAIGSVNFSLKPSIGIILGSGLGDFASNIEGKAVSYCDIKGFPVCTVAGHSGFLKLNDTIAVMSGRFHLYEGLHPDDIVLPVCLLHKLGIKNLIVTNAAGAINPDFKPGELVLINDHINLMGINPLTGPNIESLGPRFPNMSEPYSVELRQIIKNHRSHIKEGIYAGLSGPSYETPAEVKMLKTLGADMVGMSTVPEVIMANYIGLEVIEHLT